ncbi:hypothetical protein F4775DRAFT_600449 [Biscogniauxia sp. FL1348]|nr:hypothetical protein F4775DRAFT_600449 [Biscogniauxia sp. FL1348]
MVYFVEGLVTNVMHGLDIRCSAAEITIFRGPDGQMCSEYTAAFFDSEVARGYLVDDGASGDCAYCPYTNGDEYVQQKDSSYRNRAKNVSIRIGFILLN